MRVVLRPLPVLYACQGCAEFGDLAREVGALLDRGGVAQLVWLGAAPNATPARRYPILALDGCDKACALRWLGERGIAADRSYVLADRSPGSAQRAAQQIAAELGRPG
jgi:uncharacterized metal-binding protein